jgi:hypothetical protein
MSTTEGIREPDRLVQFSIPEDSCLLKFLSAIPVISIIPHYIVDSSLDGKYVQTGDAQRRIELINVKNDYKVASNICKFLIIVAIITAVATGLLSSMTSLILSGLFIGVEIFYIASVGGDISHNQQIVHQLRTQGRTNTPIR